MTNSPLDNAYYTYELTVDWVGSTALIIAVSVGLWFWWFVGKKKA